MNLKLGCRISEKLDLRISEYENISGLSRGDIVRSAINDYLNDRLSKKPPVEPVRASASKKPPVEPVRASASKKPPVEPVRASASKKPPVEPVRASASKKPPVEPVRASASKKPPVEPVRASASKKPPVEPVRDDRQDLYDAFGLNHPSNEKRKKARALRKKKRK